MGVSYSGYYNSFTWRRSQVRVLPCSPFLLLKSKIAHISPPQNLSYSIKLNGDMRMSHTVNSLLAMSKALRTRLNQLNEVHNKPPYPFQGGDGNVRC